MFLLTLTVTFQFLLRPPSHLPRLPRQSWKEEATMSLALCLQTHQLRCLSSFPYSHHFFDTCTSKPTSSGTYPHLIASSFDWYNVIGTMYQQTHQFRYLSIHLSSSFPYSHQTHQLGYLSSSHSIIISSVVQCDHIII